MRTQKINSPTNNKQCATTGQLEVHIRYTLNHPRIKSRIPEHFFPIDQKIVEAGATGYNLKPLLEYMGITKWRFKNLLKGAEPTIGEIERYAEYFEIQISELYKVIPLPKVNN